MRHSSPDRRSTADARGRSELRCSSPVLVECSLDNGRRRGSKSIAGNTAGPHGHGNLEDSTGRFESLIPLMFNSLVWSLGTLIH